MRRQNVVPSHSNYLTRSAFLCLKRALGWHVMISTRIAYRTSKQTVSKSPTDVRFESGEKATWSSRACRVIYPV